jgi:TetR/AcrR family transcriptional repressor of mexCD-oprJ operon
MSNDPMDRLPRADAQRNRAAIIDAALTCLAGNPRASMSEIAKAAGVGRVTLYGHFASRNELIEAAAAQTMARVETELAPLDLDGDPREALDVLVRSSWRIVDDLHGLVSAAEQELGDDHIRAHHDQVMLRVRQLIERGQAEGSFRTDLSARWLTACFFSLLHGASSEIRAGRLDEADAANALPKTIWSVVATSVTSPSLTR